MSKIDFARLKVEVSIDSVLGHYGIPTKKRNDTYLVASCPLPAHSSKDSSYSFAINTEKNLWTCHSDSCKKGTGMKGGDVIDLVCLMEGTRLPLEGARKLVEWFPQHNNGQSRLPETAEASSVTRSPIQSNKPLSFKLKDINPEHPMIQARGILVDTAREFGVGWFSGKGSMAGRIVFPLHEDGRLIGYAGRTTLETTPENPKWRMPPGMVKSFVYELHRCDASEVVILVESAWTVMQLYQEGYQAAALLGRSLTPQQEKCLEGYPTICVEMDDDEPGREANDIIATRLRKNHRVYKALWKG